MACYEKMAGIVLRNKEVSIVPLSHSMKTLFQQKIGMLYHFLSPLLSFSLLKILQKVVVDEINNYTHV
jgi:hypothetical protein